MVKCFNALMAGLLTIAVPTFSYIGLVEFDLISKESFLANFGKTIALSTIPAGIVTFLMMPKRD